MPVNHSLRRIASLSAFALAISITSASQAGVIPWVYDALFGPVYYRSYGCSPYAVSYDRPVVIRSYAPSPYGYASAPGCSSCSTSYYAPLSYSLPSNGCGSCGPVALAPSNGACGTVTYASASQGCLNGCSVSPATATSKPVSPSGKTEWKTKKTPEADQAPVPTTVTPSAGAATDDGLDTSVRSRAKVKVDAGASDADEGTRPASGEVEQPTILNRKKAPATKTTDDGFETPLENIPPKEIKKPNELELEFDTEKKTSDEARIRRPQVDLEAKIAWRTESQRTRVPFHAKLAKASVTRRTLNLNSDWTPVVAKVTGNQIAKK